VFKKKKDAGRKGGGFEKGERGIEGKKRGLTELAKSKTKKGPDKRQVGKSSKGGKNQKKKLRKNGKRGETLEGGSAAQKERGELEKEWMTRAIHGGLP